MSCNKFLSVVISLELGSSRSWCPISWLACEHASLPVRSLYAIESCVGLNVANISVGEDLIYYLGPTDGMGRPPKTEHYCSHKMCITLDGANK